MCWVWNLAPAEPPRGSELVWESLRKCMVDQPQLPDNDIKSGIPAQGESMLTMLYLAYQDTEKTSRAIDVTQGGFVSLGYFKPVINTFIFPLPNEIFQELMNICMPQDVKADIAEYKTKFFAVSNLNGISSHISKEKQQREEKRQTELSKRTKQIEDQANKYAQNRTVDEVIKRLKDRGIQQASTIKDRGTIVSEMCLLTQLEVLEEASMPMDDGQFNLLTEKLELADGELSYLDFVAILEDAGLNGPGSTLCNSPDHRVNDTYHYMTAEKLSQLNDKLMEVEFLCLLFLWGMNLSSTNFQEFYQLFYTQETKEISPPLMPFHKPQQVIKDAELACDHAHYYLVIKARTRWHDLAREFDSEGNGIIQPRDFKKVLFRFGIPITPKEFKQLCARYDNSELSSLQLKPLKGSSPESLENTPDNFIFRITFSESTLIPYQEFLQKLGIKFAPSDTGSSRHIMEDSYAPFQAHYNKQQKQHSKLEEQQKQLSTNEHSIYKKLHNTHRRWDKFRDYFQDFSKAHHKVDKYRDCYVAVCDLHRLLQECSYYHDHDQFSSLLNSLGISIHDSKLSYFDFLRATDDVRAPKYQQRQKQAAPPESFAVLSLENLIKIKEIVAPSDLLYEAAFLKRHAEGCQEKDVGKLGEIPMSDFLDIAEKFSLDLYEGEINKITTKYEEKMGDLHTMTSSGVISSC
ncbi:LOW QUALITY PROTEIN: EF-hand calcium-binding domain-containing protein 6 [Phaethornis superciliosus]